MIGTLKELLNDLIKLVRKLNSPTTITQVALPYTPPCNGLLLAFVRGNAAGRSYVSLNNATPTLIDNYQVNQGYYTQVVFVKKDLTVSVASSYNLYGNVQYWFIPLVGGVLLSSIFKAFSDFTSHLFGGDVDERISRKIVGEHTLTADIDNAIACIKWIINYDIHSVRKHQRLQATDSHGILCLQQQLDDSNRCGRIPIKYERTLSFIRNRIQHLQSLHSLCVRYKYKNSRKGLRHCRREDHRRQIIALERGCVA